MSTTPSYKLTSTIMMQLGDFQFGIATAAYQEFTRTCEYRWPSQDTFGTLPRLQFTGPGSDTISLPGIIYPEWRGGSDLLNDLRAIAELGKPLLMVSGTGKILGDWVIERIEDKQSVFAAKGMARKMEFTLSLRRYA